MNRPIKNSAPLSKTQNGSVIFWILIAVGLMAALSYAFMGSSRNSTSMITDTQADAYASEIIAYGNEVKSAVKRLRLRGCSDTEISFENNVSSPIDYTNLNSPADESCHIFSLAGGSLNWPTYSDAIYENAVDWYPPIQFNADNDIIGTKSSEADLVMFHASINETICAKLNERLHNEKTIYDISAFSNGTDDHFVGIYRPSPPQANFTGNKITACSRSTARCPSFRCLVFTYNLISR